MKLYKSETGALKSYNPKVKGRYDLLVPAAIHRLALRMATPPHGVEPGNFLKGFPLHICYDSALRHIFQAEAGQTDEDHLAAAMFWIMVAMRSVK